MTKRKLEADANGSPADDKPSPPADSDAGVMDSIREALNASDSAMNISANGAGTESAEMVSGDAVSMGEQVNEGDLDVNPQQQQAMSVLEANFQSRLKPVAYDKLVEEILQGKSEAQSLDEYLESPQTLRAMPNWLLEDFFIEEETFLTYCIKKEAEYVVDAILEYGVDVEVHNKKGVTAISTAAHKGNMTILKSLINHQCDVNRVNGSGSTALIQASHFGHVPAVDLLLKAGAHADFTNPKGTTALMRASQEGYVSIARALIVNGADVTRKNNEGMNALMLASQRGHHDGDATHAVGRPNR